MNAVQKVHDILTRARVSDDEIRGGIKLSDNGYEKIASRVGVTTDEAKSLVQQLIERLRDDYNDEVMMEDGSTSRFAYEVDFMGNLTIRDSQQGEDHYVSGSESAHLITQLENTGRHSAEEQAILQRACEEETLIQEDDTPEKSESEFFSAIQNESGSYNFPWREGRLYGTATAAYRAAKKEFQVQVISVRDTRGEEMDADETLMAAITQQARDFIGNE